MSRAKRAPWIDREGGRPNWYIYWYDPNTERVRRRSAGTCVHKEAEESLGHFLIERANEAKHISTASSPDQYLIATALRWYVQERVSELANPDIFGRAVKNLIDFFGAKAPVATITPQLLKQYAQRRKRKVRTYKTNEGIKKVTDNKPISSATIRRELVVLAAALNHAVKNGRLTLTPKIILPPSGQSRTRYLDHKEIEQLLAACVAPHIRMFVLLALNTGARRGAILDLRWPQVDMVNRIIYLNPEGRAQTSKRRAIVPINDSLYDALLKAKDSAKEQLEKRQEEGDHSPACPHVITYRNAPVLNIKKGFKESCNRAGLTEVMPHTLRHTAGTLMALAGIDLFLIAKVLGHSVQKTTELYAHHRPEYLRDAVNVLGRATSTFQPSAQRAHT
ncbi:MAG: site-specific integrase [Alphaproteobacteria bacterium]